MINLGDKVRCRYSGLVGVAVARTEFINGCVQYTVVPKVGKDNKVTDEIGVDEDSLVVVSVRKKIVKKKVTGGPSKKSGVRRGF